MPPLKRYAIIVQHEIIVYGYSQKLAVETVTRAYAAGSKVVTITELPLVETEVKIIDNRNAPGQ
jgi:hypothetical protein